ncbi:efflux RND transporter periplasmic adaptor subunit, partial [Escherichia coli]|nr:efflux RND transporter periplasmic adaptor subunit [Escherichia coli]
AKCADEESAGWGVRIDRSEGENQGVKTASVTGGRVTFAQSFPANGSYNEYQYALVQARAAGFIDKVYPRSVGEKVRKGPPLLDRT